MKHVTLRRTKDGYFVGANFRQPGADSATRRAISRVRYDISANARHVRWEQLMAANKGKIDVTLGAAVSGRSLRQFAHETMPNERTLCGHIDLSPRGSKPWLTAYGPAARCRTRRPMVDDLANGVDRGHGPFLRPGFQGRGPFEEYPEYAWEKDVLRDLDTHAWTTFRIAQ